MSAMPSVFAGGTSFICVAFSCFPASTARRVVHGPFQAFQFRAAEAGHHPFEEGDLLPPLLERFGGRAAPAGAARDALGDAAIAGHLSPGTDGDMPDRAALTAHHHEVFQD